MAVETVAKIHGFTDPLAAGQMKAGNPDLFDTRMPRMYPIHRHIYLYSVARRGFTVSHPYFKGELRGCKEGERYTLCYSVPDPPQQISIDPERGGKRVEVEPRDEAGWRVAIDILNPNNPSTNPYFRPNGQQAALYATGQGVDLIRYGLFPSLNNPPTEEEIKKAERTRDDSYQALVDEAFAEQASNPQNFRAWLRTNPDITVAMEALGIEADWHRRVEVKQSCPNCGDTIKSGIAFHKSSAGVLCIIDADRAAKAGVRLQMDEDEPRRGPGRPPKSAA